MLEGTTVVHIVRIKARASVAARIENGSRAPAQCVATALAMMARLSPERLAEWHGRLVPPKPRSPATFADVAPLRQRASSMGYAQTRGSWRMGVLVIGVPLFGAVGFDAVGELARALAFPVWILASPTPDSARLPTRSSPMPGI